MKEVLPWLVRWACRAGTRDFCSALAAEVDPVQNIFSSSYTISIPLASSPSKLGRQPFWVACLLVCVSGCPLPLGAGGGGHTRMRGGGGGSRFGPTNRYFFFFDYLLSPKRRTCIFKKKITTDKATKEVKIQDR
jgi:hypothetical protein